MDTALTRRGLFKVTAGALAVYSLLPPTEALAAIVGGDDSVRRVFPLDRTMLRAGDYDIYLAPIATGVHARWFEGNDLITEATLATEVVIADEYQHALAPLYDLTKDFVGPDAVLQRAFWQWPGRGVEPPKMRPFMAEDRLLQRVAELGEIGLPFQGVNPPYSTNPPRFPERVGVNPTLTAPNGV